MTWTLTNQPCISCTSSDAMAYDDKGGAYCFSCETSFKDVDTPQQTSNTRKKASMLDKTTTEFLRSETYPAIKDRQLSSDTCKRYMIYQTGHTTLFGFTDSEGNLVASKTRSQDKSFFITGEFNKATLYGQHLFNKGGRYLTITEGEFDAAASFQMTGSKYPAVSVRNGAGGAYKDCKDNYEWINSFENVVICFDNDEPGQEAAKKVAELFGNKAKIAKLKLFKDASDYAANGKASEYNKEWWQAEQYVPDGIVAGTDIWDVVSEPLQLPDACYPWKELNQKTYGMRLSELVTITAGSGLGKSQVLREIFHHLLSTTTFKIGALFLEENIKKTALSLMAIEAGQNLHLPTVDFTEDGWFIPTGEKIDVTGLRDCFDKQIGNGKVFLFDHFGSTAIDNIVNRIRYMAKALECSVVFLDHISIVISAQENGDERRAIDEIMTKLRMLCQESGILIIAVSHLKRPDGKGHEDGAATSLSQLRGSGSIAQLSDIVIGLERDSQNEDDIIRNTTIVRVLKNRFSGDTGKACDLLYNKNSGRMSVYVPELEEL